LPHAVTVNEILRCSGSQFDPDVANVFTEQIDRLRSELVDSGATIPE
jgi:HD-GYP domain-containing protein (c-di-GMP phosphodiesterase class II)